MTGEMFTVWTQDTSPEKLIRTKGITTNIAIAHGVVMARAARVLHTLQDTYGDVHAEIHPAGTPPKAGTVGNPEAENKALAATAARLGIDPEDLRSIVEAYRHECRKVIKDG